MGSGIGWWGPWETRVAECRLGFGGRPPLTRGETAALLGCSPEVVAAAEDRILVGLGPQGWREVAARTRPIPAA